MYKYPCSPKSGNNARMPTLAFIFNIVSEVLPKGIRQRKEMKGIKSKNEGFKYSLLTNNMIVYIENFNSTRTTTCM